MSICRICLEDVDDEEVYHPRCLRALFRASKVPTLEVEMSTLHLAALEMVGHTSLSGIQKKISLELGPRRATLRVAAEGGRYILKPQTDDYTAVPENEHVTTRMAQLAGIEVAPNGLIALKDGTLAFIVRRFDRLPNGRKLRQEDFCQLDKKSPKQKYDGSTELCVRLLRLYATEPLVEILKLYRLLVFTWWSGNGDMHLKNFSLLADQQGIMKFTPAYDLLCTRLAFPNDKLALPIDGKDDNLTRNTWLYLAEYCQLTKKSAVKVLEKQMSLLVPSQRLIDRSFLPNNYKEVYKALIQDRSERLREALA